MGSTAGHQEEAIVVCIGHVGGGVTGRAWSSRTTNDAAPPPPRQQQKAVGELIYSTTGRRRKI